MKVTEQTAFSVIPAQRGRSSALRDGKKVRHLLTWLDTLESAVEIGHKAGFGGSPEFWIYLDSACVGYISFSYALARSKLSLWFPAKVRFATPHSTMLPVIRGKGYASFIYEVALKGGLVLYCYEHTKDAAGLWESLSRKTGAKIYHFDTDQYKFVSKASEHTLKVLSLIKPAYRG